MSASSGKVWQHRNHATRRLATAAVVVGSVLFLIIALASTRAAASDLSARKDATPILAEFDGLVRSGHTEEAVALLQSHIAKHPSDITSRLALANLYVAKQEYPKAETEVRVAVRRSPHSESSRELLALVLAKERKYTEAEAAIRSVNPPAVLADQILYLRLLASIQSGLGHSQDAARSMERSLLLAPKDDALCVATAVAEIQSSAWAPAVRNLTHLFNANPSPATGVLLLKAQLGAKQDFAGTLRGLQSMGDSMEQKLELRLRTAQVLAEFDRHDIAEQILIEAANLGSPPPELLFDLAVEQYRAGHLDAALSTVSQLRPLGPTAETEDLAGDIEEAKGDPLGAVKSYQTAVALAPSEERYWLSLGAELIRHQSSELAVAVFQQGASRFPGSIRIFLGLGIAEYFQEKYDESATALLRADELSKGSGETIDYLGKTQMQRAAGPIPAVVDRICSHASANENDEASLAWCSSLRFRQAYMAGNQAAVPEIVRQLQRANRLMPGNPVVVCAIGQAQAWEQGWKQARTWMEKCVQLESDSTENHFRLSRVYRELGLTDLSQREAAATLKTHSVEEQREELTKKFVYQSLQPAQASPSN